MLKVVFLKPIRFYQRFLSPYFGFSCRFYPSCSEYCYQAINRHGILKGVFLCFKRMLRCAPWGDGGEDKVPKKR